MNNEQLIKQVDELIGMHRQLKTDGNDILSKVRSVLTKKSSDDYERGLNDAWELARKIGGSVDLGGYNCAQMYEIFNSSNTCTIFDKYSCQEALAKVQEYEKKKAEEAKLKPGDYVTYSVGDEIHTAILLDECDDHYWVLSEKYTCPQRLWNMDFQLNKTGKHVNLEDLFKEINND